MRISKKTRIGLIVLAMIALLAAGEVAFEWWRGSEAVVVVENAGTAPIEDFVLTHGDSKSSIPLIAPGSSVRIFINGGGARPLAFNFRQVGNPLNSFELQEFSPAQLERDGLMLNVRILSNGEIERFGDQYNDSGLPLTRHYRAFRTWLADLFWVHY